MHGPESIKEPSRLSLRTSGLPLLLNPDSDGSPVKPRSQFLDGRTCICCALSLQFQMFRHGSREARNLVESSALIVILLC